VETGPQERGTRSTPYLGLVATGVQEDQSTHTKFFCLTLWELAYDIFVPRFWPKNSSFRLPYQRPSSFADCARELFKDSNESASLVDCTWKNFFGWGVRVFCEWCHKWSSFGAILAHVATPRAQPLKGPKVFRWSFYWRLGLSLSLLSLWSTF